jgi:hypothetical protein
MESLLWVRALIRRFEQERPPQHKAPDKEKRDASPRDRVRYDEVGQLEEYGYADTGLPSRCVTHAGSCASRPAIWPPS